MKPMKTPGVYIVEKNAFPNSVVQVATAVPAFIGHTEKAINGNRSLHMTPWRISSMAEFHNYFGFGAAPTFEIVMRTMPAADAAPEPSPLDDGVTNKVDPLPEASFKARKAKGKPDDYELIQKGERYCLYGAMRLFFQNGGGACYIVSVGEYDAAIAAEPMLLGIDELLKEPEPTMVVIPETTRLTRADSIKVQQQMLAHCGGVMKNRFAILDIFAGHLGIKNPLGDPVKAFRNALGVNNLNYGAAYYPWLKTSIYASRSFTYENIDSESRPKLLDLLRRSANPDNMLPAPQLALTYSEIANAAVRAEAPEGVVATAAGAPVTIDAADDANDIDPATIALEGADEGSDGRVRTVAATGVWSVASETGSITFMPAPTFVGQTAEIAFTAKTRAGESAETTPLKVLVNEPIPSEESIDGTLRTIAPLYTEIMDAIADYMNTMAPAAAMAGIYTMVDNSRGVWKAPANVSLNAVTAPTVTISHDDQEDLNVNPQGKSINAIRPFIGEGVLVWGARTLDGNSLDWRYISVRRTMIMIEESVRLAAKAYVFEPNTANTWVTMRSMIENFLTGVWKQGGLAGATPEDAFSVHVGLGDTMTAVDILEGILRITVLVAVTRPAEFIEITFQQQMQKS